MSCEATRETELPRGRGAWPWQHCWVEPESEVNHLVVQSCPGPGSPCDRIQLIGTLVFLFHG